LFDLAEPIPGPTTARLAKWRSSLRIVVVDRFSRSAPLASITTRRSCSTPTAAARIYRKMHIPTIRFYYEKYYFTPGDLGTRLSTLRSEGRNPGVLDQWYPEGARLTALQARQFCFIHGHRWHPDEKEQYGTAQYDAWQTMQRAHAIAMACTCAPSTCGLRGR